MKLKSDPIEIPKLEDIENEDQIFKNDKLKRKEEIEILTNFVQNVETPFVITVNSQWGNGKTTFIRLWRRYLEFKNIPTILFNAWETEFLDMPLFSLIGELDEHITENKNIRQQEKEKLKNAAKGIYDNKLNILIKLLSRGTLAAEEFKNNYDFSIEKYKELKKGINDLKDNVNDTIKDILKKYNKNYKNKEKNKEITGDINIFNPNNLIFFIDELDRCKPFYVINMLEKIKHFFNIKNVVFVLSIDKNQIQNALKSVYSNEIEAKQFLNKIIDLNYDLKSISSEKYLQSLITKFGIEILNEEKNIYGEKINIIKIIRYFCNKKGYSYRQKEFFIRYIVLVSKVIQELDEITFVFTPFIIFIMLEDKNSYKKILNNNYNPQKLINNIIKNHNINDNSFNKKYLGIVEALLRYKKNDPEMLESYRNNYTRNEDGSKSRAYYVVSTITSLGKNIKEIKEKMEKIIRSINLLEGIFFSSEK
ncbi:MAG: hypothetical protein FXF47_02925 [Candidatus Mcinerneyibacterium aminivorans]|uniref:KAP NTPase domain-containing protein n=1 Tax=Candidatus Mcinerneyibacterium aminivorans TaxID=2703815 RepID=A0A5D0MIX0_9BACT|nr:MAG: hypothetical protein FXF47_02925 [Candidatus Mcinerneyibacterium aminivorans]